MTKYIYILSAILILAAPACAATSTMRFVVQDQVVPLGSDVAVTVFIDAAQPANAVSGLISFPKDKLQLSSISTEGSVVSFWTQKPSYSNTNGTARFEGVMLGTPFHGSGGRVVTLTFRSTAPGSATVRFQKSSLLANDGKGTNLLNPSNAQRMTFSIVRSNTHVAQQGGVLEALSSTSETEEAAVSTADLVTFEEDLYNAVGGTRTPYFILLIFSAVVAAFWGYRAHRTIRLLRRQNAEMHKSVADTYAALVHGSSEYLTALADGENTLKKDKEIEQLLCELSQKLETSTQNMLLEDVPNGMDRSISGREG